jgi:NB-ARC domain
VNFQETVFFMPTDSIKANMLTDPRSKEDPSTGKATGGTSNEGFELVPSSSGNELRKREINLPLIILNPFPSARVFRGRDDILSQLEEVLLLPRTRLITQQASSLRQFALCGVGGLGKTEIALEFAWRHKDAFDAIFWLTADSIAKLNEGYQNISLRLGLEDASEASSQVVSRELVKGWLADPWKPASRPGSSHSQTDNLSKEATWLIVFDNADDPALLTDYWPQGNGSVLITSRDPLAKSHFSLETSGIDLNPLTAEEGSSLVMQLTGISESKATTAKPLANRIATALGGLPLAISQMTGIIRRQDLTLDEFIDLYEDRTEHSDLHSKRFESSTKYPHSIATVWALDRLKPESRKLLELIAYLDPDVINESLLTEALPTLFPDMPSVKTGQYMDWRTELTQTSLVKRHKDKQELSVHRLVQDVVQAKMSSDDASQMFDLAVRLLWSNWPSALPTPSKPSTLHQPKDRNKRLQSNRWPQCAALYPHVMRLHQLWRTSGDLSAETKLIFACLIGDAAWYDLASSLKKLIDIE